MGNGLLLKLAVGICCALAVFGLSSCAPRNNAVGDTQQETAPAHDNIPGARTTVAVIAAPQCTVEDLVIQTLSSDTLDVIATSTQDLHDPDAAAQQAVLDAITRRVHLVMLCSFTLQGDNSAQWADVLEQARQAGIPVALLEPCDEPANPLLYAAVLHINDRMADALPLAQAVDEIIQDKPHERELTVTTLPS